MSQTLSSQLATRNEAFIWFETVLFAVINAAAFLGNFLTFYAVCRNSRLRTVPNLFVTALTVSDILISTCCMPFTVATLFYSRWIFGETFCRVHGFEVFTFGTASLVTMVVIAISRCFRVVKSESYPILFSKKRALIYIAAAWCVSLIPSLPPLFFKRDGFEFQPGKAMCLYTFKNIVYVAVNEFFYIATTTTVITICYVKVFQRVTTANRVFSQQNNLHQLRVNVEEAKVTKTLLAVLVGFASCWLPIGVIDNIDAMRGEHTLPRRTYITYAFLLYLSSALNPIIYAAMSQQFRREYKDILSKIFRFRSLNDAG